MRKIWRRLRELRGARLRCPRCGSTKVDLIDFATFAICYGQSAPNPPDCSADALVCSDLDGSGTVNLTDFATFATWYGIATSQTVPDCTQ